MTPGRRSGLAVIAMLLCTTAGCGSDHDPEVSRKMTPDRANQVMRTMVVAVMGAAVPGEEVPMPTTDTPIPCGGLEGTEYSKIKYGVTLESRRAFDTVDDAFGAAVAKLEDLGYEVDPVEPVGTTMVRNFHGDVAGGALIWHGSGPITLNVETRCLRNPGAGEPAAGGSSS